jgi:CheY-like chemotaxis protein
MHGLAADMHNCQALIIDANPTSRSILSGMLQDLGVSTVVQTAKLTDARKVLESRVFDVVLCDYHFDDADISGQDLLEDLRRAQILPFSTVFVMVTAEASYAKVAEAAESALDSYLLKPHNSHSLAERLHLARHRKKVLKHIFQAIEDDDFETAAKLCVARFTKRDEYWLYAARIGAELLLNLGRHDEARELFEAIRAAKALPWAKLGIARAHMEAGQHGPAKRTLESLIADNPTYADAFDIMGRAQLEQGEFEAAYETYQRATDATPSSIARLQKVGMMAFYLGKADVAVRMLERATRLGVTSKMFDYQTLVMLAQLRFEAKDSKGVQRCLDTIAHAFDKQQNSARLRRLTQIVQVLQQMQHRQVAEVVRLVKVLAADIREPDFDFEAACNVLGLLARLKATELELPDADTWIHTLAARFCVSKASSELLTCAARAYPAYEEVVRAGHASVGTLAEQAMTHALAGSPGAAAKSLFVQGAKTHNAKLLDLADMVLNRYREQITDPDALSDMIQELRGRYCKHGAHVQLGKNAARQSGGLRLRN